MAKLIDSMTARVTVVLVAGVVVSASITQVVAERERISATERARNEAVLSRCDQILHEVYRTEPGQRAAYLSATNKHGARVSLDTQADPTAPRPSAFALALAARMEPAYRIESLTTRPQACLEDVPQPTVFGTWKLPWKGICEHVRVTLPDGQRTLIAVTPPVIPRSSYPNYLPGIALFLGCTLVLGYWVARMTTRPLHDMAEAALRLGKDIHQPPLPVGGVAEIRQASAALNTMQGMIRDYIRQRTEMLAAITHDLQTPLTRMRFRLEKVEDPQLKEQLLGDLADVLGMVREGLDLAKSTDNNEPMQKMDLDSLLDSVCCDAAEAGQPVTVQGQSGSALLGRPLALRRCLGNLIDNAVQYGGQADVTIERRGEQVWVRVADRGPGIAEAELGKVFDPFYRIESSRSRRSGGTGLGLTIARNIAVQHRGNVLLENRPGGGLEAILALPYDGAR